VSPYPSFCENLPPKKQMAHKGKVKVNALKVSNKVEIWDLLKGGMSLMEDGWQYGKI
jgi:hypothetical protein